MTVTVDTHTHYVPPTYRRALLARAEADPAFAAQHRLRLRSTADDEDPANSPTVRLAEMAAAGVDRALMSLPPPGATFGSPAQAARVAAEANDELLDTAAGSGGRLWVLAALPLPYQEEALVELDRLAGHPLLVGVQVITSGRARALAPDAAEPVLAAAARAGLPVVLHPAVDPQPETLQDFLLEASLAPVWSSTVALARLVLGGTLDRLPGLALVVPHLGGFLPYVLARLEDIGAGAAQHPFGYYLRHRVWLDSCNYHPPALRCAVETAGADRIVLGSDWPFRGSQARAVADLRAAFVGPELDAVLGGTAAALFPAVSSSEQSRQ